jgi:Holliday junction resolvase
MYRIRNASVGTLIVTKDLSLSQGQEEDVDEITEYMKDLQAKGLIGVKFIAKQQLKIVEPPKEQKDSKEQKYDYKKGGK